MKKSYSTYELCIMGVCLAVLVIVSQITIPMPYGVPMTLQTLAIMVLGMELGSKKGTWVVLLYILLGAIGVPVFANFGGGISRLFAPSGGFLLSFPLMSWIAGKSRAGKSYKKQFVYLLVATILNLTAGMLFYRAFYADSFAVALMATVIPFIPTALLKIVLAMVLSKAVHPVFRKIRAI